VENKEARKWLDIKPQLKGRLTAQRNELQQTFSKMILKTRWTSLVVLAICKKVAAKDGSC
jgi:hypothetical protein